jgi:hypothetical protein
MECMPGCVPMANPADEKTIAICRRNGHCRMGNQPVPTSVTNCSRQAYYPSGHASATHPAWPSATSLGTTGPERSGTTGSACSTESTTCPRNTQSCGQNTTGATCTAKITGSRERYARSVDESDLKPRQVRGTAVKGPCHRPGKFAAGHLLPIQRCG